MGGGPFSPPEEVGAGSPPGLCPGSPIRVIISPGPQLLTEAILVSLVVSPVLRTHCLLPWRDPHTASPFHKQPLGRGGLPGVPHLAHLLSSVTSLSASPSGHPLLPPSHGTVPITCPGRAGGPASLPCTPKLCPQPQGPTSPGGPLQSFQQVDHEETALPHLLQDVPDPAALAHSHLEHGVGSVRAVWLAAVGSWVLCGSPSSTAA